MHLIEARAAALALMHTHGVTDAGWTFRFDRAIKRLGFCDFRTRTLSMGAAFVLSAGPFAVTQTMLHEIAHVHAGAENGHNKMWQQAARKIGHSGLRTARNPAYEARQAALVSFARSIAAVRAGVTTGPLQVGESVVSINGRYRGLVVSIGQTRCRLCSPEHEVLVDIPIKALRRANLPAHAPPNLPVRDPDIVVGDCIVSRDRTQIGAVVKIARTRYHFRSDLDGQLYGVAFANATAVRAGAADAQEVLPPQSMRVEPLPLKVLDRVVTYRPGSVYDGLHGTIVSAGPANLRVVLDDARLIIVSARMVRRE